MIFPFENTRGDAEQTTIEITCTDVMEPFLVVVIRSCIVPMSVAKVGW